jgi:energy-coupling factor transport system substrate-specific component
MREVFTMWSNTRMVVLVALTAALYAAVLIPFKPIPIIPGFTEIRPAVAVPVVFGALFGPAAAWGSGIGNVIGDFFGGTLSLGSLFGFVGNFLFALTPYKLLGPVIAGQGHARHQSLRLLGAVVLASAICAATIAWGLDLLGLLPFTALGSIVFVNNLVVGALLGPVLLRLVGPRVASWHLLWTDIMEVPPTPALRRHAGIVCMWLGGIGALGAGLALSIGLGGGQLFAFTVGAASPTVAAGVAPFLVLYLVGCALA